MIQPTRNNQITSSSMPVKPTVTNAPIPLASSPIQAAQPTPIQAIPPTPQPPPAVPQPTAQEIAQETEWTPDLHRFPWVRPKDLLPGPINQVTGWVLVTPMDAEEVGAHYNNNNRKVTDKHVARLSGAMTRGEWRPTHQGIAFDENMQLVDGQNRLLAIQQSGCSQWMMVTWDLPAKTRGVVDTGKPRTLAEGYELGGGIRDVRNGRLTAIRRFMSVPGANHSTKPTSDQLEEWLYAYEDGLRAAFEYFPEVRSGCHTHLMRAAFARAWYTPEYRDKLLRASQIVLTQRIIASDRPAAANLIRLMQVMNSRHRRPADLYGMIQHALRAYLDNKVLNAVKVSPDELFMVRNVDSSIKAKQNGEIPSNPPRQSRAS